MYCWSGAPQTKKPRAVERKRDGDREKERKTMLGNTEIRQIGKTLESVSLVDGKETYTMRERVNERLEI